jgi:DNA-binding response OmpR family regulator
MTRILVVDDEEKLLSLIVEFLAAEGFTVETAQTGNDGLTLAKKNIFDLIVLDWMLPDISGLEVIKELRKQNDIPVIFLTAKTSEIDKLLGLELGADDYITKPFYTGELLARIRVLLKRINSNKEKSDSKSLEIGKLKLCKNNYKVEYDGENVDLTKKEFELLEFMMVNKNIVLTRDKILDKVWGYDYFGDTNIIDVYIRYLRSKIDQKYNVNLIETVRGVGYIIRE